MPNTPERVSLSDTLLASAHNVQAVLDGRSLTDSLAATSAALRPSTQAVTFHVMRKLGLAYSIKHVLVERTPPNPLFDALLLVSLALLDTAVQAAQDQEETATHRRDLPVYAVHTLVDQAVTAVASQRKLQSYKGLLNATLRNYLRERDAILAQALEDPVAKWNHPGWWVEQVRRAYPEQWQQLLADANLPGPMALRVNRRRASTEQVLAALKAAGIEASSPGADAVVLGTPLPVQAVPGFNEGWWSVQDLSAQRAATLLPVRDGMRVLDACAAPGGKTAHLLERVDIELLALDAEPSRLERVTQNLQRLGLDSDRVTVRCANAMDLDNWWDGRPFDAVLADVPCTSSGVVRRHPDIRWLRRETDIQKTAALQGRIIDALWKTVKPGGHLLYATCSIFPLEGERQAQSFLRRHEDAERLPAPGQILPVSQPGQMDGDGFFYALFAKQPVVVKNEALMKNG
jgi:16S rRNA (cytosine967-C5)-methyltransferase